ncbi:MAG TPA: hypothetical protein VNE86_06415 [Nitrososphaerales archaeon]|nr:hypothetical protein [Nitrososphaerales archaeon]
MATTRSIQTPTLIPITPATIVRERISRLGSKVVQDVSQSLFYISQIMGIA